MTDSHRKLVIKIGSVVFLTGLTVLTYGAIALWLIQSLPPNGGPSGRLPSLYVMGTGIVAVLIGLAVRDLRLGKKETDSAKPATKSIPASWGILILVLIIAIFVVLVSQQ